jgi:DNA polymerase I
METWAIDTEFGYQNGRLDCESAWRAVCLCALGLHSGERVSFWGPDPELLAWFRQHRDDQFVTHFASAEMKYLIRLGIPLPDRWYDTYIGWRRVTNRPGLPAAGLSAALHQAGLPHLAPALKRELQERIARLEFDPEDQQERQLIIDYCFSDCAGCAALYRKLEQRIDPVTMAHWIEYVKVISRMELRGVPIDVTTARLILRRREAIRAALINQVNRVAPLYRDGVFRRKSFWAWCHHQGISWPWTRSTATGRPYRALDDDTLENMEVRHPYIAQVRQVRKTLRYLGNRGIKCDGLTWKHYYNTSPFRSVTGRNQPRNFIFCGPKWFRFLIVPESQDHILVYVDFIAQEIGIAAALSGDSAMRAMYEQADAHIAFAILAGAAPPEATKDSHQLIRKQYKTVNLGVLYGQSEFGISARLGIPKSRAQEMLVQHHDLFPDYWTWSDSVVQAAFDRGEMRTPCGWGSRVPSSSNVRTWMNFPIQATGADIMRLVVTYLDRQSVDILAPVHDGFLLSCRRDQLEELHAAVDWACSTAVEQVIPGFPLRWETVEHEGRFYDKDGAEIWAQIMAALSLLEPTYAEHFR